MFVDPSSLANDLDRLEEIEKASLRLVTQAILDFRVDAAEIYQREKDLQADIGEDITREALDRMGVSRIDKRLFGKIDYKRARYVFHPNYAIKQALLIDSKAEKGAEGVARIQTAQTSMRIRLVADGADVDVAGELPTHYEGFLTTTIFVKYHYRDVVAAAVARPGAEAPERAGTELVSITLAAIPNGMLQARYNPDAQHGIWNVGPHSPARGEAFRVRLSFSRLAQLAHWRVQHVPLDPAPFTWVD